MTDPAEGVRRICVVTGSRAEYGLLHPLMKEIAAEPSLALLTIVTGAHLEQRFGNTVEAIKADGFAIDTTVPMDLASDAPVALARSLGAAISGIAAAFERLAPDLVVVLGDRYEILAAVQSALLLRLPVAHIHGGEITEGAVDDAIRHAITKMAHLHFVAAEPYRGRVIQMGEAPERVFTVGALALDNLAQLELPARAELERDLDFALDCEFFLVTYHPATLGRLAPHDAAGELVAALDAFPDHKIIVTGTNADPGRDAVAGRLAAWAASRPGRILNCPSMGQKGYLAAMQYSAAVVGNSSSGILEAPALGVPTVNVGTRQHGRLRAASVIDCGEQRHDIVTALNKALDPDFRANSADAPYPFGKPGACRRIREILASTPIEGLTEKTFFDMAEVTR